MAWATDLLQRAFRLLQLGLNPVTLVCRLLDVPVALGPLRVGDVGLWPGKPFQSALELGEDRLGCLKVFAGGQFAAGGDLACQPVEVSLGVFRLRGQLGDRLISVLDEGRGLLHGGASLVDLAGQVMLERLELLLLLLAL